MFWIPRNEIKLTYKKVLQQLQFDLSNFMSFTKAPSSLQKSYVKFISPQGDTIHGDVI